MKIFSLNKTISNRLNILGAKIEFNKLNSALNSGFQILLRHVEAKIQTDFRIKKHYLDPEKIKSYYTISSETGKEGFDSFSPRLETVEKDSRFGTLNQVFEFLEDEWAVKKQDWVIEKKN
jgi:hypothetical protein